MEKIARCPKCTQGNLHFYLKSEIFTYRGHSISLMQPGQWCDHCIQCIITDEDMLATETKLKVWKEEVLDRAVNHAISTAAFKREAPPKYAGAIRKYWEYSDLKLGEIADRLQESVEYLSAVLKGNAQLSAELAAKIEKEFGISADELMRVEQRYIQ